MKHIYVFYIGLKEIPPDQWNFYTEKVRDVFKETKSDDSKYILIPDITKANTELVCINPEYITNENLIKKHENELKKLNKELVEKIKEFVYE
jgi:hypothetical protein